MSDREAKVVLTADNTQYNKSIEDSQKATEKLTKSLEKASATATKINKATAKGLFKIGAGEVAGLTALSTIAATLEKQTSNIQSNLALNKTSSQYSAVTSSIRELSRAIPVTRAEIAGMATEISNLGFVSGSQISKVTNQFSKMGVATGESPTALAQSMVQFQRNMGVAPSAETMGPYNQSTTLLSARAGVPAGDILSFASNIAPASRVAGLNQSTVLGLSTAATRAGADGTYASSTISQILNDITMLRYSKSPEIKRYSSALGIPLNELTGEVSNSDTFNRNIVSKILSASQTEEGPTRLGMLGFDGLRAKKALQMMASEPGGVEQWINTAQYGMGTKSVETGFEAASGGLADQMVMLRNRMTDLGQVIGTPTMEGFTVAAKGANALAGALQPLTDVITKILGLVTGPLAAMTMGAGAVLGAWKTFSTYSFLKRGVNNVGTSAFASGFVSGQGVANGADPNIPINTMAANVMSGDPRRASGLQRTIFGVGSALGTMAPNMDLTHAKGPFQKSLEAINRATNWMVTGAQDWYKNVGKKPEERYASRIARQEEVAQYRKDVEARKYGIAQGAKLGMTEAQMDEQGLLRPTPERPAGMFVPKDRYTVSGTVGNLITAGPKTAWAATKMAAGEAGGAWNLTKQVGSGIKTDFMAGPGAGIVGGLGSLARGLVSPQMLAMYGGIAAYQTVNSGREYEKRWNEKGSGFDGEITNGMTLYNEKLGIATTSLERFAAAVDEANPAKTDDANKELGDKVYQRGTAADYQMQDERIKMFVRSPESAQKYIASQGRLNTDQLVTVFTDLAKVLSRSDWNKVREATLAGRDENGNLTAGSVTTDYKALSDSMIHGIQDSMSIWQKAGANVSSIFSIGGFDPLSLTSSKQVGQVATDYIGTAMSTGAYIGDTKDASKAVITGSDTEKSATLTRAVQFGKAAEALTQLNDVYQKNFKSNSLGTETAASRSAFFAAKDRLGEFLKVDLKGILPGRDGGKDVWDKIYSEIQKQSEEDPQLKAMLDSGLITQNQQFGGQNLNDFITSLPEKKITTSVDTMIAASKFGDKGVLSDKEKEKWFGKESVLKDLGTGIGDPVKQLAASFKMLQLAQDKFGGSITSTDSALQSFKNGLVSTDPSYAIIEGAQQINQMQEGQFFDAGASPTDKTSARTERRKAAIESAKGEANPADAQEKLTSVIQENNDVIIQGYLKLQNARKQNDRQTFDFYQSQKWQSDDFYRSQEYAEADFQRSVTRSKAAFHRQFVNSEASFYRSLKYQSQDFYRSRVREEEQHGRQLRNAAEDTAKSIGDPYNRMQLQMINDPASMQISMQNRLGIVTKQNQNIDTLKNRGLSQEAVNQLDLANFSNAQQTNHLANTATDADIAKFNELVIGLTAQGGQLNKEDTGMIRAEEERGIALTQGLEDFLRNLKRTKVEHAIQVKFSQKEFRIGLADSAKEHSISMDRAKEAFERAQSRSQTVFDQSIARQKEDLTDYFATYAKTQEQMVKEAGKNAKALGLAANNVITAEITAADKNLRALWKTIDELGKVKVTIKITRPSNPMDAGDEKPKPKDSGGSNASTRSGSNMVWDPIKHDYVKVKTNAAGGIGTKAQMGIWAEAGPEALIPLNARGIDFMSQFTKGVAREMTRSLPRTPVSASNVVNQYDHSQNVRIDGMVVESNDPKKFVKELQKEAQKKRAALYKS